MARQVGTRSADAVAAESPRPEGALSSPTGRARGGRGYPLVRPLAIYTGSRLFMLVVTLLTIAARSQMTWEKAMHLWDGAWYLDLAERGYPHGIPAVHGRAVESSLGFFPLFPLAMRGMSDSTGLSLITSGLIATTVSGAVFALVLWWLLHSLFGVSAADRATAMVCFFPGFFAFGLLYSEPVSLALTAVCLYGLLRRRWWPAGVAAGLASAARPNAAILVVVCGASAASAIWRRREWMALAAPLLAPLGLVLHTIFLGFRTGSVFAYERVQEQGWRLRFRPLEPLRLAERFVLHPLQHGDTILQVLTVIFILVAGVLLIRSDYPRPLVAYGAAVGALDLFLVPTPRFALTAFPLIAVVGHRLKGPRYWIALAVSASGLAVLLVLTLLSKTTP